MQRSNFIRLCLLFTLFGGFAMGQSKESDLRIFGYFQTSFSHITATDSQGTQNSFNMQQLNIFLQKDLARQWTSFINLEMINSFSSNRAWGAFNLEEAWIRYRGSRQFSLRLGLQIPIFNHLNEIKNRMPLLPYIIRPLVYESSFEEFIALEEYLPARAFVQSFGYIPVGKFKIDHAVYVGNSPNIANGNDAPGVDTGNQTGTDTTRYVMVGGRLGIRYNELKLGVSGTHENTNFFQNVGRILGQPEKDYEGLPRIRLGADFSFQHPQFSLEAEYIRVDYDEGTDLVDLDKQFVYATLGWRPAERSYLYVSYWLTREEDTGLNFNMSTFTFLRVVEVPNIGMAYSFNERTILKAQLAKVNFHTDDLPIGDIKNHQYYGSIAVSVFF